MKKYKINIVSVIALIAILFSSCNTEPTMIGHWRCDATGTMTGHDKEEDVIKPITFMYDAFGIPPLEFEFLEGGEMIWYNSANEQDLQEPSAISCIANVLGYFECEREKYWVSNKGMNYRDRK